MRSKGVNKLIIIGRYINHGSGIDRRFFADKPTLSPLPRTYNARFVESRWYDWWISQGYFKPRTSQSATAETKECFSLILPPPNVTGSLHLGHALTIAIEDALVRWHRMLGHQVLWVPGLDHAGIATQVQVEKQIWMREKRTRHDLGREEFLKQASEWKDEKSERIKFQIRRMGASLDWDKLVFTLDENIQKGVRDAFIRLFEKGKIYRQQRMVNWCGFLKSTISDIEVEHRQFNEPTEIELPGESSRVELGYLDYFAYPVYGGNSSDEIVVATTRLETMLGDSAVAVHPEDSRYKKLIGKFVLHPFLDRLIPIIPDESVDQKLGTGAVKITPVHDFHDFELGTKHRLPFWNVIDDSSRIVSPLPELNRLSRFAARKVVQTMLQEKNLWRGRKPHQISVPFCSRSGDIVEPQLKDQWFLDCREYSAKASTAVSLSGELQLMPDRFNKIWKLWLSENKDWCLSRQLWWGQQIPAFKVTINGKETWTAAHSLPEAVKRLSEILNVPEKDLHVVQDEDVLDTWFTSSALPFLSFGWPEVKKDEPFNYYPLSLMETGHDILFFWVARMVFMGLALTDQLPFNRVLLHGLICDKKGKKMSKSSGNVIDPMEIICDISVPPESGTKIEIGSDSLRFALCRYETQQHFINVDLKDIEEANRFCNKIWQAFHLCLDSWNSYPHFKEKMETTNTNLIDQWIIGCLRKLIVDCNLALERMELNVAAERLYFFWYEEFCDVYLECVKPILKDPLREHFRQRVSSTALKVFDNYLRLISIFMPNLAEELYQRLPNDGIAESVCVAKYPTESEIFSSTTPHLEDHMQLILAIGKKVKNIRAQYGLMKEKVPLFVKIADERLRDDLKELSEYLTIISRSQNCTFIDAAQTPSGCALEVLDKDVQIYVQLQEAIDVEKELQRYGNQLTKLQSKLAEEEEAKLLKRFLNGSDQYRNYVEEKVRQLKEKIEEISAIRDRIKKLLS